MSAGHRPAALEAHLVADRLRLFDVGARGGIDPRWGDFYPYLDVSGFEPDPAECDRLNRESDSLPYPARFHPYALGRDTDDGVTFYVANWPVASSIYPPNFEFLAPFGDAAVDGDKGGAPDRHGDPRRGLRGQRVYARLPQARCGGCRARPPDRRGDRSARHADDGGRGGVRAAAGKPATLRGGRRLLTRAGMVSAWASSALLATQGWARSLRERLRRTAYPSRCALLQRPRDRRRAAYHHRTEAFGHLGGLPASGFRFGAPA